MSIGYNYKESMRLSWCHINIQTNALIRGLKTHDRIDKIKIKIIVIKDITKNPLIFSILFFIRVINNYRFFLKLFFNISLNFFLVKPYGIGFKDLIKMFFFFILKLFLGHVSPESI